MLAMFGLIELFFGLLILPVLFLGSIFWIWMLIDCALHENGQGSDKIVWILIILLTHFLGALIYFFARRPERRRQLGA
jgi:hypothetical protein